MSIKVEPCPFCNSQAVEWRNEYAVYYCFCKRCKAQGPSSPNLAVAHVIWNDRVKATEPEPASPPVVFERGTVTVMVDPDVRLLARLCELPYTIKNNSITFKLTDEQADVLNAIYDALTLLLSRGQTRE